jgi:putative DNA-invertase from lambdoid prophage Rac
VIFADSLHSSIVNISKTQTYPVVIYARVSTDDQRCEMQLTELREFASRFGWTIAEEYIDQGFSGSKADRPALTRLMRDASMKRFAAVIVWKLDRFGRSVSQLVSNVRRLDELSIRFLVPSQSIDTDHKSPTGRLMMHILAAMAEFERDLIRERVSAGLTDYRQDYQRGRVGKLRHSRSGKDLAVGRPRKIFRRDSAAKMRADGLSWRAIAAKMNVPASTIRRAFAELRGASRPDVP